ncbi:Xanthine dehydrogenase, partial [Armadillidium vulgare]
AVIVEPELISNMLALAVSNLTSLVIFTRYSALLVSILATLQTNLPFRNFKDLQKLPEWKLGVLQSSAMFDLLSMAPEGSTKNIVWKQNVLKYSKTAIVTTHRAGLENVFKGFHPFSNFVNWSDCFDLLLHFGTMYEKTDV